MQSVNANIFSIDDIIVKISKEHTKSSVKYAFLLRDLLTKVNDETKKLIERLKKKYTSTSEGGGDMTISRKGRKDETILREGLVSWIKSMFSFLTNYLNTLTSARKQIEKIAEKMGIN